MPRGLILKRRLEFCQQWCSRCVKVFLLGEFYIGDFNQQMLEMKLFVGKTRHGPAIRSAGCSTALCIRVDWWFEKWMFAFCVCSGCGRVGRTPLPCPAAQSSAELPLPFFSLKRLVIFSLDEITHLSSLCADTSKGFGVSLIQTRNIGGGQAVFLLKNSVTQKINSTFS